jgi:RNA polymerase sigma-70 factor (ECF subfamily)
MAGEALGVPALAAGDTWAEPGPVRPAARVGEEEAARLRTALEGAVRRVCPGWLAGHADDIVQVALMRVLAVHDGRAMAPAYLWRAAYSAMVDEIRRQRRRREIGLEDAGPEAETPAAGHGPEQSARAREIGHGLRDCLQRLLDSRRLAVVLHLQGHTVPEAARILGWAGKRVENLVYRGLFDLRRCLTAKGLTP